MYNPTYYYVAVKIVIYDTSVRGNTQIRQLEFFCALTILY